MDCPDLIAEFEDRKKKRDAEKKRKSQNGLEETATKRKKKTTDTKSTVSPVSVGLESFTGVCASSAEEQYEFRSSLQRLWIYVDGDELIVLLLFDYSEVDGFGTKLVHLVASLSSFNNSLKMDSVVYSSCFEQSVPGKDRLV